ncbi:hypothetical protein HK405_002871, partial [Cladochytrium tenue]
MPPADEASTAAAERAASRFYGAALADESSLYLLPADTAEKNRLHLQHVIMRSVFGGSFHTPQRKLFETDRTGPAATILDVGCGSASWVIEMAKTFPKTKLTAVLSIRAFYYNPADEENVKEALASD